MVMRALVVLRRADEQLGRLAGDDARAEALRDRVTSQYAEVGCRLFEPPRHQAGSVTVRAAASIAWRRGPR